VSQGRIELKEIVAYGPGMRVGHVGFSPRLTVIHGASDTGKSYILEAIDYVLGAKSVRAIREIEGYSRFLLGLTAAGVDRTLSRPIGDGDISVWNAIVRDPTSVEPEKTLKVVHSSADEANISRYMLQLSGMDGWVLAKNQNGEVANLSFRDVMRVVASDETRVQAVTPPFESGMVVNRSKERSLVRAMLAGVGDPPPATDVKRKTKAVRKGQVEVIERLIRSLIEEVGDHPPRIELEQQLSRLHQSMNSLAESLSSRQDEISEYGEALRTSRSRQRQVEARMAELRDLSSRFDLLRQQYVDDLARLETIDEASFVLTYLDDGPCAFCGAAVEHQARASHAEDERSTLAYAVDSERTRIHGLLIGLDETLGGVSAGLDETENEFRALQDEAEDLVSRIRGIESHIRPRMEEIAQLRAKAGEIERLIGRLEQLDEVERFRVIFDGEEPSPAGVPLVSLTKLNELELRIRNILGAWMIAEAHTAAIDPQSFEISLGDRLRSNRGKGMRAILDAASIVGLADYCIANELPHPGFIILDSPLVTYKGPKAATSVEDEAVPDTVVAAFYRYLDEEFVGQAIILENTEPEHQLQNGTVIEFTGSDFGREGFIPPREQADERSPVLV